MLVCTFLAQRYASKLKRGLRIEIKVRGAGRAAIQGLCQNRLMSVLRQPPRANALQEELMDKSLSSAKRFVWWSACGRRDVIGPRPQVNKIEPSGLGRFSHLSTHLLLPLAHGGDMTRRAGFDPGFVAIGCFFRVC